jgi:hypothetical protein
MTRKQDESRRDTIRTDCVLAAQRRQCRYGEHDGDRQRPKIKCRGWAKAALSERVTGGSQWAVLLRRVF